MYAHCCLVTLICTYCKISDQLKLKTISKNRPISIWWRALCECLAIAVWEAGLNKKDQVQRKIYCELTEDHRELALLQVCWAGSVWYQLFLRKRLHDFNLLLQNGIRFIVIWKTDTENWNEFTTPRLKPRTPDFLTISGCYSFKFEWSDF